MFVSQGSYVPMATLMNIYIVRIKMLALRLMTHRYKITGIEIHARGFISPH